jgi:hypothetical protein
LEWNVFGKAKCPKRIRINLREISLRFAPSKSPPEVGRLQTLYFSSPLVGDLGVILSPFPADVSRQRTLRNYG